MRLLFMGDLEATGFGTVTMDLGRELLNLGHDVRFVSQNVVTDGRLPEPFESRRWKPPQALNDLIRRMGQGEQFNPDAVTPTTAEALELTSLGLVALYDGRAWDDGWTPEAAIYLGDPGNSDLFIRNPDNHAAEGFATVPTYHYVAIEGIDLPPTWSQMWRIMQPVAMSRFGAEQIAKVTGSTPPYVYHGVDTSVFRPVDVQSPIRIGERVLRTKADCKKLFGIDKRAKILLRTDRLMPRKLYASLLRSMQPVLEANPDTFLLLHCATRDQGGDLLTLKAKMSRRVWQQVIFTGFHDQGLSLERASLAALYNAADLYVSTSAEGFGLTIAEAIACGVPAVGLDYSAVPEVIGPAGRLARVRSLVDNEYGYYWAAVDERDMAAQVQTLLSDDALRRHLAYAGPPHVRAHFSWKAAAETFSELMSTQARAAA